MGSHYIFWTQYYDISDNNIREDTETGQAAAETWVDIVGVEENTDQQVVTQTLAEDAERTAVEVLAED